MWELVRPRLERHHTLFTPALPGHLGGPTLPATITPTTRAALPGITRRTVLEIAAEQGIDAVERDVWPMELHAADGAFVCGSGAGVVPIGSFDGRPVRFPDHPLIQQVQAEYRAKTRDAAYRTELYVAA